MSLSISEITWAPIQPTPGQTYIVLCSIRNDGERNVYVKAENQYLLNGTWVAKSMEADGNGSGIYEKLIRPGDKTYFVSPRPFPDYFGKLTCAIQAFVRNPAYPTWGIAEKTTFVITSSEYYSEPGTWGIVSTFSLPIGLSEEPILEISGWGIVKEFSIPIALTETVTPVSGGWGLVKSLSLPINYIPKDASESGETDWSKFALLGGGGLLALGVLSSMDNGGKKR